MKSYQFRWALRMAGIFMAAAFLARGESLAHFSISEIATFIVYDCIMVFTCWYILGYFLTHSFQRLSPILKDAVSIAVSMFTLLLIIYIFASLVPNNRLISNRPGIPYQNVSFIRATGSFFITFICYTVLSNLYANDKLQTTKFEHEQLKQEHLQAQLLSLQQQVSPHFLFNSLSTLKTITREKEARDYIVQLAKVYRHLLNFSEHHLTALRHELDFLKSYLHILHMRFEDSLKVAIHVEDAMLDYMIPPLSLQLLVENAIKHNIVSPEQPLTIMISVDKTPAIVIENNYAPKGTESDGTGIGLQNINQRYKLLVHKPIQINQHENKFVVTLPLFTA